jgi:hypothetical protein
VVRNDVYIQGGAMAILGLLQRAFGWLCNLIVRRRGVDERTKRQAEHAPMIRAADEFLRAADRILAEAKVRPGPLRALVPYGLWVRLMQLARTVNFLTTNGYAEEAKTVARAMLSTAVAIKLVTVDDLRGKQMAAGAQIDYDKESEARALAYLAHHTVIRRRQNQGYLKRGWVDKDKVDEIDRIVDAHDAATLAEYAKNGIAPAKLGGMQASWHGLSDEAAADAVGVGEWYDIYYRPFSEESHGSEPAVRAELDRLLREGRAVLGPQFEDPYPVLRALVDTVGGALLSLDRHFGIGREAEVRDLAQPLVEALAKHQSSMDPVTWRRMMSP